MTDDRDPNQAPPFLATLVSTLGNVALAVGLVAGANYVLALVGAQDGAWFWLGLAIFFSVIYADPVSVLVEGRSLTVLGAKLLVGAFFGVALSLFMPGLDADPTTAAPLVAAPVPPAEAPSEGGGFGLAMWLLLLVTPLMMFGPLLEKIVRGGTPDRPMTTERLVIAATFPAYLSAALLLNLAIPWALWTVGAPLSVGIAISAAGVLICVLETWAAPPEEWIDEDRAQMWRPAPTSAAEACHGLRKALRQAMATALFIGGAVFVSVDVALPRFPGLDMDEDLALWVWDFALGSITVLGLLFSTTALGALLVLPAAWLLISVNRGDPLTLMALARQTSLRLFMGGMTWVSPDLNDD